LFLYAWPRGIVGSVRLAVWRWGRRRAGTRTAA
jgi:hypothetical protein